MITWQKFRAHRASRWVLDGLMLVTVLVGVGLWQTRSHLQGPAPSFELSTLDGQRVSLASLKGKPVMLAFWAPWCAVCQTESKNLSWAHKLAGDGAQVFSVASAYNDPRQVTAYAQQQGVDYPVLLDTQNLASAFRVEAYPTVYFLDAEGRVKHSVVGYTTTLGLLARLWW